MPQQFYISRSHFLLVADMTHDQLLFVIRTLPECCCTYLRTDSRLERGASGTLATWWLGLTRSGIGSSVLQSKVQRSGGTEVGRINAEGGGGQLKSWLEELWSTGREMDKPLVAEGSTGLVCRVDTLTAASRAAPSRQGASQAIGNSLTAWEEKHCCIITTPEVYVSNAHFSLYIHHICVLSECGFF